VLYREQESSSYRFRRIFSVGRAAAYFINFLGTSMNKDQVEGRVDQVKGKIKEVTGRVTGKEDLEAEGNVDQASGKVQSTYGDTKEKAKDAIKSGADKL
jgi:uncharacterized protein YjbJ (UPF0337 family)